MKNNKKKLITGIGAALIAAVAFITIHHFHSGHSHGDVSGEMTLNNGEKWKADISTKNLISAMTLFVKGFSQKEKITTAEYNDAGESLRGSFNEIFAKCTMEGPAHDELHKYLMKLSPQIEKLQKGNSENLADTLQEILNTLLMFNQYFS